MSERDGWAEAFPLRHEMQASARSGQLRSDAGTGRPAVIPHGEPAHVPLTREAYRQGELLTLMVAAGLTYELLEQLARAFGIEHGGTPHYRIDALINELRERIADRRGLPDG